MLPTERLEVAAERYKVRELTAVNPEFILAAA